MLPSIFVRLEEIPLSPNGKPDRARLPHPDLRAAARPALGPRTETERALERIWCEVLGVDAAGVHQPFLELGGHSLRAMGVLSRIAQAYGV